MTGSASMQVASSTAVTAQGAKLANVSPDSIEVEPSPVAFGSLTGTVVAVDTQTALYAIDVCVTHDESTTETCTTTTGLGNWRIDHIETGSYRVVASDAAAVYATATGAGVVAADQVGSVDELAMDFLSSETVAAEDEPEPAAEPTATTPSTVVPTGNTPIQITYQASIAGVVTGLRTEAPIEAAQVCATQPRVLLQSCGTTQADGSFMLDGLSAGNYWLEVIDPLGRFEQVRPRLVGVVGDDVARTGVAITLAAITE